jgi:hypothetical protein
MSAATSIGKGLILLCFIVVVYISLAAYEMDNNVGQQPIQKKIILASNSCANPATNTVESPGETNKPEQVVDLTVISRDFFLYLSSHLRDTPYAGVQNYTNYIIAKSKLNPLTGVIPLRSDFGPVLNDVNYFRYPIEIPKCRNNNVAHLNVSSLFVAIISAPNYFDKRNVIRQTWLSYLQKQTDLNLAGFGFVVGLPEDQETRMKIEAENDQHNDILQIEMRDDYYNLTLKVVGLLNWINDRCSRVDFVLKVDDDVYVNVRNLREAMKNLNSSEQSVYGSVVYNPPQRGI